MQMKIFKDNHLKEMKMDDVLSDEQLEHEKHLLHHALLSAMEFIAGRLMDSNQESYELIGFDDSISTILMYHDYKVIEGDKGYQLSCNGVLSDELYLSDSYAQYSAMRKILDK